MANDTLDEKTELEIVNCYYCNKEVKREEAWYSPGNLPYCNENCFRLFTED